MNITSSSLLKFFTYKIPQLIKHNNLDEHYLLLPIFAIISGLLSVALNVFGVSSGIINFLTIALPIGYYIFLTFLLIKSDYDYDVTELNLSANSIEFLKKTTQTYKNEIRFYMYKISMDAVSILGDNPKEQDKHLEEITNALISNSNFKGKVRLIGDYLYAVGESPIDTVFTEKLIRSLNLNIDPQYLPSLAEAGVDLT